MIVTNGKKIHSIMFEFDFLIDFLIGHNAIFQWFSIFLSLNFWLFVRSIDNQHQIEHLNDYEQLDTDCLGDL